MAVRCMGTGQRCIVDQRPVRRSIIGFLLYNTLPMSCKIGANCQATSEELLRLMSLLLRMFLTCTKQIGRSQGIFCQKFKHTVRGIHWAEVPIFLKENRKALINGKKVLDFGSGSGVVALAAARDGAERVIGCDSDKDALEAIRANAELNRVPIEPLFRKDFCQTFAIKGFPGFAK